jgi:putative ABC transport system substrate-binding protein
MIIIFSLNNKIEEVCEMEERNICKQRIGKTLVVILVLILCGLGLTGCSKPKVYKIGVLSGLDFIAPITDGLKEGLTALGYIEGENIIYDVQKTNFDMEVYRNTVKKFIDEKVDLIVTFPTEATIEAKKITQGTGIPVVFSFCLVEGMNIIDSIQKPGGNITGVRYPGPDIAAKRFEIMQELVPEAKNYYIPFQKGYPIVEIQLEAIRPLAKEAGITIIEAPAVDTADLKTLLKGREIMEDKMGIDAIIFLAEPLTVTPDNYIVLTEFAYKHNIPIGGAYMGIGDKNVIFGLNTDIPNSGKEAAPLVDKILKGTDAGTIPVVSSEMFLEFNTSAAEAFGVKIPEGLLQQAAKVYR